MAVFNLDGADLLTPHLELILGGKTYVYLLTGERLLVWYARWKKICGLEDVKEGELSDAEWDARVADADEIELANLIIEMLKREKSLEGLPDTLSFAALLKMSAEFGKIYTATMLALVKEKGEKKGGTASA